MARGYDDGTGLDEPTGEIDLHAIARAIRRRSRTVLLPTILAFVAISIYVNIASPRYTAETQVLLENQETFFTRPDRPNGPIEQISQFDPEAVASQIQLVVSRDIARRAIAQLKLKGNPEFDPLANGMNPLTRALVLFGFAHDPSRDKADARIVTAFLEKLTVFSPTKTRVITIQFSSKDPVLAAKAADTVAALYLQEQSAAKRDTAKESAESLAGQITDLRTKLAKADADRETYRLQSGLLSGTNNMTISGQQLAEINTDLSRARTSQADAQAKASTIRQLLREGKAADVPEVINNDIVRRVSDQRITAQAQLALESRTLMPGHPRIKELTAQVAQFDLALKGAAKQAATTLENEAKTSGQRVANLEAVLNRQKQVAGVANTDEVHLRALERTSQAFKDQLDSSSTKYQEALARQSSMATPADARVIARAAIPQEPSFPKKLPFIAFGTLAAFVLSLGYVVASELLSGAADGSRHSATSAEPAEFEPVVARPILSRDPMPERAEPSPKAFVSRDRSPKDRLPRDPRPNPVPAASRSRRQMIADALSVLSDRDPVLAPVATPARSPVVRKRQESSPFGVAGTIAYLRAFGRSASESRGSEPPVTESFGFDPLDQDSVLDPIERRIGERRAHDRRQASIDGSLMPKPSAPAVPVASSVPHPDSVDASAAEIGSIVGRIVAAHVPGRGLHIVGTAIGSNPGTQSVVIDLGRALSDKGRAVIVDLNHTPMKLASLAGRDDDGLATIATIPGLSELLAGTASFAEVIHRDHLSRLHFIPAGLQEADFRDFDLILDALSETYDFIVLLTPAFPQSEIAKVMAPYADFVVLAATGQPEAERMAAMQSELIEAGAHQVLVTGMGGQSNRPSQASA